MTRSPLPHLVRRVLAHEAVPVQRVALAAAVVIGVVTRMPAGAPDAAKKDGTEVVVARVDDGVPLPAGAVHRFGNRLARHPDGINGVTVSPDGKLAATIGQLSVIVWDLKTMAAKCILRDQVSPGYYGDSGARASFFPDSKQVLVAVYPGNNYYIQMERGQKVEVARVYDVETGKLKFAVKGDADYWTGAWLTAKGKEIAAYAQQAVTFYDAKDGKELRKVACGPELNGLLAVAPEANLLAMRRNDNNTLTLIDGTTGQRPDEITVEGIGRVALTPDGKRLAVSDGAGKVHIRDVKEKKELFAFAAPAGKGTVVMRFSADQQTLFIGGQHGRMYRWDLKTNKKLADVGQHSTWSLTSLALSPDETVLYSTANDKLIKRWDLKTLKEVPAPDGYITQTAVVPLPDRRTMLVADHQGALDRWDLASGKHVGRLQGQKAGGIDCVAVSADGRWFAGGRTTQDVTLWDLKANKLERIIPLVEQPDSKGSDHVRRVAFSGDGRVLFTGSGKTGITAWEVPTGKKLWHAPGIGPYLAVDPKGRWVAAGGGYNREQVQWTLLNQGTGEVLRKVDVVQQQQQQDQMMIYYPAYLGDLRFTPDGSRLVTSHYDNALRIWEPGTGREVARLTGNTLGGGLTISADGRWAGVGQSDKKITLWELASGKKVLELTGHDSNVRDVAFTPDGKGIVGNADLAPVLWALDPRDSAKPDATSWDVLVSDDGAKAYRAQWALVRDPAAAIKLLGEKVKPAELALDRSKFDKWVADLDSPQFRLREAAERELTRAGLRVPLGWLRKALDDSKGDEPRARLTRVLTQREKPNPEEWRLDRAVQVLELAGTPEALALLKAWAAVDGSPVTEASREAVGRVGK